MLIEEYIAHLAFDLDFQDHQSELSDLANHYGGPHGALFLAEMATDAVGVVGVRPHGGSDQPAIAEMKRMYVCPAGRGRGLGRELAAAAIGFAAAAGYRSIRLDTDLDSMPEANRLYESLGFVEIDPYRDNPLVCARYMELELQP